ncbi:hypothetical protein [Deinococcus sp. QL22]|uniref:hypothetical protein n=1 Tax=Deinococcus sp. QL22 TaxID=2939437 RepID=UPI002017DD3B|nr:hypothetical protein [Deinococcus sp. QL22]UQN07954.1 hypothetical protein M1R55_17805 [Deinococcus sp. QL22]
MSWRIEGDTVIAEEGTFGTRVMYDLYQAGLNAVPQVLLDEQQPYGVPLSFSRLRLSKDQFMRVHGSLRQRVRSDSAFNTRLRHLAWSLLRDFTREVLCFERAVARAEVTPAVFDRAWSAYVHALSLNEFNGVLPLEWYEQQLATLPTETPVKRDDFAYSEVTPHRIRLRVAKLRLAERYLRIGLTEQDVYAFIANHAYLDPRTDSVLRHPLENPDVVRIEAVELSSGQEPNDLRNSIRELLSTRRLAKRRYHEQLQRVDAAAGEAGWAVAQRVTLLSSLSLLSFAVTEEEYRHIWQDRFQRALGAVLRGLEMPAQVAPDDLRAALRQRPHFTPDLPARAYLLARYHSA